MVRLDNRRFVTFIMVGLLSATSLSGLYFGEAIAADLDAVGAPPPQEEKKEEGTIRPGRDNVDLEVYGHVNQAFLFASGAGDARRADIVDNDNSGSRFGFRGRYKFGDWFSSVRLEFAADLNSTNNITFTGDSDIGQDSEDSSDFLDARWVHWNIGNKNYGNLSVGFTEEASQGASERDLSGTTLIAQSDVDDIGGELQFGNSTFDELGAAFEVDDFFNNLDGGRDSAVHYELPKLAIGPGELRIRVAGRIEDDDDARDDVIGVSLDSDDGVQFLPSAGLRYDGEINGFEFSSAAAYRREEGDVANFNDVAGNNYIGSFSVLAPTGTSLTFGGGVQTFNEGLAGEDDPNNERFFYVKAGQKLDIFDFGKTSFSIDAFFGRQEEDLDLVIGGAEANVQVDAFSVGGGVVQTVKPLGTEIYAAARYYDIEFEDFRDIDGSSLATDASASALLGEDPDGIFVFFTGARVRF